MTLRERSKEVLLALRSRIERRFPRLKPEPLDSMGRGPREPSPCPPLQILFDAYGPSGSAPEVLLLGDSTSVLVSPFDLSRKTLATMVARGIRPLRTCVVAGVSYHPAVYEALVRAVTAMTSRPKVVVVPINVRHFSPEWTGNPNTSYKEVIAAAEAFAADPSEPIRTVPAFRTGNLLRGEPGDPAWEGFLATPVAYPGRAERTVGDFVRALHEAPTSVEERRAWLQTAFAFHFLYPLVPHNERLASLAETIRLATAAGCAVVAYLVPANHQAGADLLGDDYENALAEKSAIIVRACDAATVSAELLTLENWTRLLTPDEFFIPYDVLSHINESGRRKLAPLVARCVDRAAKVRSA